MFNLNTKQQFWCMQVGVGLLAEWEQKLREAEVYGNLPVN